MAAHNNNERHRTQTHIEGVTIPLPRGIAIRDGGWTCKPGPPGPIAAALQSASVHNAAISIDLTVISPYMHEFNIVNPPWRNMQKAVYRVCEGAAFHTIAFNRKPSVDKDTMTDRSPSA